ncbi:MAG: PadR family transcriptional regulator [Candidatus Omnitrophica bacterium]|nr:PadR family transcriptional regulator [Candidatus Omnitrophota bacterium]
MIQRLIILGILKNSSVSGYDIKKIIEKELGVFSKIETKSIYYPLKKMVREGLIKREEIKSNKHINKFVYSITPKGEKEFVALCKEALLSKRRPFIELDIAIYFLPFLKGRDIMPYLRLRLRFLESVKRWLINKSEELKEAPKNLSLLINHHLKLAVAEKDFLKDMIKVVKENNNY